MLMAAKRSKSKPQLEFQDGGRLFSETGSSNISAVDGDVWSKFGIPSGVFKGAFGDAPLAPRT